MGFYKILKGGYILGVAKSNGNGNITEAEYNSISAAIRSQPVAPDGYQYRLTTELEWELSEIPVVNPTEEEISEAEALAILLGGVV